MKAADLAGWRFGKLVAVERVGSDVRGASKWRCSCDCGGETQAIASNLRRGHVRSCGCLAGTPEERFWAKVDRRGPTDCWVWTGAKSNGYGQLRNMGKLVQAHRFAYEVEVGPIPDGFELDHLCRNRACVNPAHLEPVDHRTNVLRGVGPSAVHAQKTSCVHGHPFDEANTRLRPNGKRECRACHRTQERDRRRNRRMM